MKNSTMFKAAMIAIVMALPLSGIGVLLSVLYNNLIGACFFGLVMLISILILVWDYTRLTSPDIPKSTFERVAEERREKLLKEAEVEKRRKQIRRIK